MLSLKKKSTEIPSAIASPFRKSDLEPNWRCIYILPDPFNLAIPFDILMESISISETSSIVECVDRLSISPGKSLNKSSYIIWWWFGHLGRDIRWPNPVRLTCYPGLII